MHTLDKIFTDFHDYINPDSSQMQNNYESVQAAHEKFVEQLQILHTQNISWSVIDKFLTDKYKKTDHSSHHFVVKAREITEYLRQSLPLFKTYQTLYFPMIERDKLNQNIEPGLAQPSVHKI